MESNKTPIVPIELTVSHKSHPLLNHLVRLALRMREHGWLGSKCLTYEMESPQRIRVEYSINASVYHKRLVVVAEQEKIKVLTTLRPKGRRFLQQDANVLAQQCFSPR